MGWRRALLADAAHKSTFACPLGRISQKQCAMSDANDKMSREERLAAKLRENLRRRKTQTREMRESGADGVSKPPEGR